MFKKIVFASCVCLLSLGAEAQTNLTGILQEVEKNNKELQAFTSLMKSQELELKSGNTLPDPQIGAYYLPFGEHNTGDYSEFQISQSFEFPTVYGARNRLIDSKVAKLNLEYALKRQEVLLAAQKYVYDLIAINRRLSIEQQRVAQAKTLFDQVQELFRSEQVGILELNKAKIAWMQEQFNVQQLQNDQQNQLLLLQNLNGGESIDFFSTDYANDLALAEKESLWQDINANDPKRRMVSNNEEVSNLEVSLSKNKSLPNLTAGYNYQGIAGSNYSGIYAGVSIPLWSNRHKVKAAQSKLEYQQSYGESQTMMAYAEFEKRYNEYRVLHSKFQEYRSTLDGLNSDSLLLEAYNLGQISFMNYYVELQFYRQAFDAMLDMEKQLNQRQAELLKHQL